MLNTAQGIIGASDTKSVARRLLALDTLSQLFELGLRDPSLDRLLQEALISLVGQFSVSSGVAVVISPESDQTTYRVYVFGGAARHDLAQEIRIAPALVARLLSPDDIGDWRTIPPTELGAELREILDSLRISTIHPLVSDDRLIGFIGLGPLVTGRAFTADDLSLLRTLVNSITPLVANVLLFQNITWMNEWHLNILNSVNQAVFVFDPQRNLKKLNAAATNMLQTFGLGIPSDGQNLGQIFEDEVFSGWEAAMDRFLGVEFDAASAALPLTTADPARFFNVRFARITQHSHQEPDLVITFDDVTEQRQSEQRLYDLTTMADKGQMASQIAHELNNFLAIISAQAQLARLDLTKNDNTAMAINLERLTENIFKMRRYTEGLVDIGKMKSVKVMVDLAAVVDQIMPFIRVQKKFARLEITADVDRHLPPILIDPDQVTQVLINYMNNAADAIQEAKPSRGTIEVRVRHSADFVIVEVGDNGTGMTDEVKAKLFSECFTTKERGHGFGLITCRTILEGHQAISEVDSAPGRGTTMRIKFPLTATAE